MRQLCQRAVTGLTQPTRTPGSVRQGVDELQKTKATEVSLCPLRQLEQGAPTAKSVYFQIGSELVIVCAPT